MRYLILAILSLAMASCASSGGNGGGGATPEFEWPKSKGTVKVNSPRTITGSFDGGMKTYDGAGLSGNCGQNEDMEPMFILKNGARLRNVIIKEAPDGIHIEGDNVIVENVFWPNVCEDAITIKSGSDGVLIKNCAAKDATDKIIQVNRGKNIEFFGNFLGPNFKSAIRIKKGSGKVSATGNTFLKGSGAFVLDKGVSKPTLKDNTYHSVTHEIRQD